MRNAMCRKCELCHKSRTVCVWGGGPIKGVMLVGGSTSYSDALENQPFTREAGDLLDHILFKLGSGTDRMYMTNLIKCAPGKAGLPKGKALDPIAKACMKYLWDEIKEIRPLVVVPMGSVAVKYLAGYDFITRVTGFGSEATVAGHKFWMLPCHHPNSALQSPSMEKDIARVLARALTVAGMPMKVQGEGLIYNYKDVGGLDI